MSKFMAHKKESRTMKISQEKLVRIRSFAQTIDREKQTPTIERIAGLFPRGYISIVASQAGTGKTWLMQYIASQLSLGGKILGGMVYRSKPYKSVIMSGETGSTLLDIRQKATCWKYNKEMIHVYSSIDMGLAEIECMLNTKEGQETAIAIVSQENPDIVFYDTLISWHTIDESKQGEMTALYMFLLRMAKAFNCAVVVNHHTRKRPANLSSKKYTQEDVIGTSAGVRLASSVYVITAEDIGYGKSKMTVENVKAWDKKVPSFTYKFVDNPDSGLIDFEIGFDTEGTNIFWSLRDRLIKMVKEYAVGTVLKPEMVAQELNTSPDYCRVLLGELEKIHIVRSTKLMGVNMYIVETRKEG